MANGIGIDVTDIARFDQFRGDVRHHFVKKVFTKGEIEYCFNHKNPAPHLAGIFSVKEAVSKAFKAPVF